ncbi:MAG: glycosyltransferase, partial [Pseudomonadota bacterium]
MADASRRLRIAHLAFSSLPATVGGLEIVVEALMREQRAAGHEVTLVTRWRQARTRQRAGFDAPILPLPPRRHSPSSPPFRDVGPRWPVAAAALAHQLRRRFDIWHAHWVYPTGWMVHDALARLGTPVVMTGHGADLQIEQAAHYGFRQHAHHDRRVRDLVPRAAGLTAVSAPMIEELLALGAHSERTHLIPNGVESQRIGAANPDIAAIRARLDVPPSATLVLSIGRAEHRKGWQFAPETLSRLCQAGADVIWLLVGKGSETLQEAARAHGVVERMRFLAPIQTLGANRFPPDGVLDLYRAADLFVFPSLSEGHPLVLLEAMAAGAPII